MEDEGRGNDNNIINNNDDVDKDDDGDDDEDDDNIIIIIEDEEEDPNELANVNYGLEREAAEDVEQVRRRQRQQQRVHQQVEDLPIVDNKPVMGNVLEGVVEEEEEEDEALGEEPETVEVLEDERQHNINYAVNSPVEVTALTGHH